MVLSIAIDLKLTSGALVSPSSLLRILLWLWLLFKRTLGVCSIRNSEKQWSISIMLVHDKETYREVAYKMQVMKCLVTVANQP